MNDELLLVLMWNCLVEFEVCQKWYQMMMGILVFGYLVFIIMIVYLVQGVVCNEFSVDCLMIQQIELRIDDGNQVGMLGVDIDGEVLLCLGFGRDQYVLFVVNDDYSCMMLGSDNFIFMIMVDDDVILMFGDVI